MSSKKALFCNKIFKIRCISHLCTPKLVQHRAKTERNRAANSFACIASTNQGERAGAVALLSPAFFVSHAPQLCEGKGLKRISLKLTDK